MPLRLSYQMSQKKEKKSRSRTRAAAYISRWTEELKERKREAKISVSSTREGILRQKGHNGNDKRLVGGPRSK